MFKCQNHILNALYVKILNMFDLLKRVKTIKIPIKNGIPGIDELRRFNCAVFTISLRTAEAALSKGGPVMLKARYTIKQRNNVLILAMARE